MSQTRTHLLEGRIGRSGLVNSETWHVTNEDSLPGGEEERGAGLVSLETWHVTNDLKRGLTNWRGRGRSGLVSSETWHVTNEDSQTGGEKREEKVGELGTS